MAKKAKTAKPTKSTAAKSTLVTFLLDRSGSMEFILDATIEAFNDYIGALKKSKDIEFTLVQFDHWQGTSLEKVCVAVPVAQAPDLSKDNYKPRGGTPLIEAAIQTITAVAESLAQRTDKPKVVVCIQTDGEENQSDLRFYTWDRLQSLVKEKIAAGWEFNFMGAGIDAYKQGAMMGFSAANTMSYDSSDLASTKSAFGTRGMATSLYASGARADISISNIEKSAAGDKFFDKKDKAVPRVVKTPLWLSPKVDVFKL